MLGYDTMTHYLLENEMAEEEILPTNDIIFKIIFGDQKHSRVLIHFLNAVIQPKSPIKSVKITQTELTRELVTQKGVRLDIAATTEDNQIISIEMQKGVDKHMDKRVLYYWSRLFAGQLIVSEKYRNLCRTISIAILDFTFFEKDDRFWRKILLKDDLTNEALNDLLELHFIEIGKMKEMRQDSPITFWVEFFKDPYSEKVKSLCKFVPEIQEAKDLFEKAKSDPKAQELIRLKEKAMRDYFNDIAEAKDEGEKIGEARGIEKGEKIGAEKERAKADAEKREMARKFLKMGLSAEQIAEGSGLSIEEIKKL